MARKCLLSLVAALMLCVGIAAQDEPTGKNRTATKESTVTGCLTKGTGGGYVLTDEKTGQQIMVTGNADLEKHSTNHRVRLTGTESNSGGAMTFEATKIQHLSASCTPPSK